MDGRGGSSVAYWIENGEYLIVANLNANMHSQLAARTSSGTARCGIHNTGDFTSRIAYN
jgi:hypothetical protein